MSTAKVGEDGITNCSINNCNFLRNDRLYIYIGTIFSDYKPAKRAKYRESCKDIAPTINREMYFANSTAAHVPTEW